MTCNEVQVHKILQMDTVDFTFLMQTRTLFQNKQRTTVTNMLLLANLISFSILKWKSSKNDWTEEKFQNFSKFELILVPRTTLCGVRACVRACT